MCRGFDFVVDEGEIGSGEGMMVRVCRFRYKIFSRR